MAYLPATPASELVEGTTVVGMTYIPTIETTVVTTTKTTTTTLPQVIIKPQVPLSELDGKNYPLASSVTPASLRSFVFDVNGTPTLFQESSDPSNAWRDFTAQKRALLSSQGTTQSTVCHPSFQSFNPSATDGFSQRRTLSQPSRLLDRRHNASLSRDTAIEDEVLRRRKRRRTDYRPPSPDGPSAGQFGQNTSLLDHPPVSLPHTPKRLRRISTMHEQSVNISEPRIAHQTSIPLLSPAPQSDVESSILNRDDRENQQSVDREAIRTRHYFEVSDDIVPPVATPPIGRWDVIAWEESQEQSLQGNRNARNVSLMNGLAQGASLPSPTLSPTLGMPPAELRARRRVSESAQSEVSEQQSRTDHSSGTSQQLSQLQAFQDERLQSFNSTDSVSQPKESPTVVQSVPNLASVVTSFENMDPKMQTYLLYQLLRRSTKETIKTVTQICDPALRVDFVRLLPQELRINIIQYLDVKTLCRAAQVSKHWRHIIDTAEHLWKRAITADGMHVSEDELWRAIREGWGWQSPYGPNAAEDDLNQIQHSAIDSPEVPTYDGERTHQIVTRAMRGNRRAVQRTATRSRRQPKKIIGVRQDRVPGYQNVRDSPQAARNLAESLVVPDPGRLPSLQDLHLYKSLYRRHHQLRRSWFDTQVKPLHLAFKAHSTKVVTCLQFDSDKIVSGSDDHLINVYDTQTGALRNSLVGHEGGVWAFQYIGKVLVSGSTDRTVRLWDLDRGVCTHILEGHTSTVRCLQVVDPVQVGTDANGAPIMMPPERLIISGSRDSSLRIWKFPVDGDAPIPPGGIIRGEPAVAAYHRRVLAGHHHSVRALDAYGDRMVSGSYDTSVCVWSISTGERLHRLNGHMNKVYSVVLDHKRDRCISGAMDSSIKIWSLETGGVLHNLEGHSSLVGLLSLDHGCLVSAAADSTLRIWDPETGQCRSTLEGHTGAITCFQHDTRKVISGSDKNLKVWDITTGRVVSNILTDLTGVWQCKFNERRCVAAVSRHGHTYIEVVDFGAVRDGVPADKRGRRVVVNRLGQEIPETIDAVEPHDMDPMVFHAMANHAAEDADDE